MRIPATIKWIGLALLGLAIAAAVAIAAGNLASQQIGISNEPLTAGDQLAPAVGRPAGAGKGEQPSTGGTDTTDTTPTDATSTDTTRTETTSPTPPTTPSEPQDDSGGHGGGSDD